jgi:hypothetical protein
MAVYGTFFEQGPIDVDLIGPFGGPSCNSCLAFFGVTSPQAFPLPSGTQIATRAPEVDPSSALNALTLLLGSVTVLASLRRKI